MIFFVSSLATRIRSSAQFFFLAAFLTLALSPAIAPAQPADSAAGDQAEERAGTGLPAAVLRPDIPMSELDYRLVPLTKDDLAALAAEWLGIVKAKTQELVETQISISNAEGAAKDVARQRISGLSDERKALFDRYGKVVSAWEAKGGDEAEIAEYRAYRNAIVVGETQAADFKTLALRGYGWLISPEGGLELMIDVAIVIIAIVALLSVAGVFRGAARRWFGRVPNLSKLLQAFLATMVFWLVMAIGLMMVFSAIGVDISPVFALIGGASFIMAFAFQDTLGNLASGLMIMVNRPFDEGHYVDVGGVAGTVKSVSIVATTVITPDNQVIVIPNKNVWGNVITNVTASATRRVDLVFGIAYEDSIPDAIRVMQETLEAHPLVMKDPAPTIRVNELADSSVNFICRPWARTSDYWEVYWDLMRQMKEGFDAAGLSIPYPQRDVHVIASGGASPEAAASPPPSAGASRPARSFAAGDDGAEGDKGD